MVFIDILLVFVGGLLLFAPITGYLAASYGRSFWRWFGLGLVLPFISVFIILFLCMRERAAEDEAARTRR